MTPGIKTHQANRLARELAALTGDNTMTEAVTRSLNERLDRERRRRSHDMIARVAGFVERALPLLDTRPVTRDEWDAASDDPLLTAESYDAGCWRGAARNVI